MLLFRIYTLCLIKIFLDQGRQLLLDVPAHVMAVGAMPVTDTEKMLKVILGQALDVWRKDIAVLVDFGRILRIEAYTRRKSIFCDHVALDIARSKC